jgi:large subunit ribosomal protein L21
MENIMYAVVKIAGKQFRVEKDTKVKVPLLPVEPGKQVHFDQVLIFKNEKGELSIGNPVLEKVNVSALVLKHGREKKIIVFRKKRRKGFQRKRGHRQDFTLLEIQDIGIGHRIEKVTAAAEEKISKGEIPEVKTKTVAVRKPEKKAVPAKEKTVKEVKKAMKKPAAAKKASAAKKEAAKKKPATKKK